MTTLDGGLFSGNVSCDGTAADGPLPLYTLSFILGGGLNDVAGGRGEDDGGGLMFSGNLN
jgi:hypothetical protein